MAHGLGVESMHFFIHDSSSLLSPSSHRLYLQPIVHCGAVLCCVDCIDIAIVIDIAIAI